MKGPQCRRGTETTDTEKKSQAVAAAPPSHKTRYGSADEAEDVFFSARCQVRDKDDWYKTMAGRILPNVGNFKMKLIPERQVVSNKVLHPVNLHFL